MNKTLSVVLMLVALSLAACKRENSVTGPPAAARTLSGQVMTVGDLAGSSPAGINVTSQGQVAVTDGNGRFMFLSLTDDAQLNFTRADGISASAEVGAVASSVVVELQRSRARVRVARQARREIEGLITAISETSITVNDARTHGEVTATITDATIIRHGNRELETTDLDEGDRVHVKANINADETLTAVEIMVQNFDDDDDDGDDGGDTGQVRELEGLVRAISESSITVANASTHRDETATITGDTIIRRGNRPITTNDIPVGSRVHVKTEGPRDALVAREIRLQN